MFRGSWHLHDIVPVLQRLRWGKHGFANLRYGPVEEVDWECGKKGSNACSWAGGTLFPGDLTEYERRKINHNDMLYGVARDMVPVSPSCVCCSIPLNDLDSWPFAS